LFVLHCLSYRDLQDTYRLYRLAFGVNESNKTIINNMPCGKQLSWIIKTVILNSKIAVHQYRDIIIDQSTKHTETWLWCPYVYVFMGNEFKNIIINNIHLFSKTKKEPSWIFASGSARYRVNVGVHINIFKNNGYNRRYTWIIWTVVLILARYTWLC
jgi:hypothetical protein